MTIRTTIKKEKKKKKEVENKGITEQRREKTNSSFLSNATDGTH